MFYVLQNESTAARRRVPILLTDAATGTTAQTGVATTTIFAYVAINGNAFIGGTGSVGEAGFGQYYYEFQANEVGTLGLAGIHITAAGCRDYDAIAQIAAFDLYSASAGGGISAYDVWEYVLSNSLSADSTIVNINQNVDSTISGIPAAVWNEPGSLYSGGTLGENLYQLGTGVTGYANTPADVWSYAARTITGGIADTVQLVATPVEISYPSMAGLANTIWSSDVSGYTSPSAGYDLTQAASGGSGLTAGDVWDFTVTGFGGTGSAAVALSGAYSESANTYNQLVNFTPSDIWSYAGIEGRTITGGLADTVTTLTNRSGFAITGGTVDTVTNAVNVSTASMAGIANTVWSTLTAPYTTHATFGHQILRSDNAATIGEVTLHQSGGSKRVDADVHAFVNNTASATAMLNILTGIGASMTTNITGNITGNLSGSVGSVSGAVGSVTSAVDVSTTSMSGIANTIWSTDISGYTSPSAGFDLANASSGSGLTAGDVWTYASRTLTSGAGISAYDVWAFIPSSLPLGSQGESLYITQNAAVAAESNTNDIGGTVWTYVVGPRTITGGIADTVTTLTNRSGFAITGGTITTVSDKTGYSLSSTQAFDLTGNITGNLSGSVGSVSGAVGSVTSPVTFDSAQYAAIASSVWNAGTRTLTSSGAGLTAGDVWSYATREITGGIADTVVNPVNVSTGSMTGIAYSTWSNNAGLYDGNMSPFGILAATGNYSAYTSSVIQGIGATIWEYDISAISTAGTAGSQLNLAASSSGSGISAGDVWSYGSRTITGGLADTVTTITNRSGFAITGGTVDTVTNGVTVSTNNDKTGYSLSGTQSFNLTGNITGNLSGSVGSVSGAVGSVTGSVGSVVGSVASVTNPVTFDSAQYAGIASSVWNAATRTLTSAGAGLTAGDVWSYATRTITGGIADTVTTITDRSGFAITGGTVDTVTNPVTFDSAQYSGIASSVWNAATRTLTSSGSGISAFDVWNFVLSDANTAEVDLVQAAAGSGLTSGDVWSYASRTITGGIADTVTTLTNRSGFAITGGTVDTVTNGVTVSTNNDKTGYSLSGSQSFNLTGNITGNLSGSVGSVTSGVTVSTNNDKTGYALSGAGVSAVQSGLSTLTQAQVGTEVDASLVDVGLTTTVTGRIDTTVSSRLASASYVAPPTEAAIAGTVWGYATRTLTSGAGATAGDVWAYPTRSLTSGAGITVNAATNIINGPYFVKSNVDGQDGNLDVIRGMVQDIQLTVTDAFQNPFDVTALGLAVNFYDQAGTLVTSYGTSNLYAPAGLVQFTLDTAVTSNEGRYNLILSAAGSGNTIKFGPLQTLVRPF